MRGGTLEGPPRASAEGQPVGEGRLPLLSAKGITGSRLFCLGANLRTSNTKNRLDEPHFPDPDRNRVKLNSEALYEADVDWGPISPRTGLLVLGAGARVEFSRSGFLFF